MGTPTAALGLQGLGAATSAMGAYASAKASKAGLKAQASIDEINARQAETAAQTTILAGQQETGRVQMSTAQLKSRQRAVLAANGVDLGGGSAAEILTSTDVMGEIDANTVQANAIRAAWGHRIEGTNATNAARSKRSAASAISPFGALTTSLLSSAGSVAKSWYEFDKGREKPRYGTPPSGIGYGPR